MTVYFLSTYQTEEVHLTTAFQRKNQVPLKSRYWHYYGIITDVNTGKISVYAIRILNVEV
jgi:hypothetical protein